MARVAVLHRVRERLSILLVSKSAKVSYVLVLELESLCQLLWVPQGFVSRSELDVLSLQLVLSGLRLLPRSTDVKLTRASRCFEPV